ncbi:MAG: hypothetical protein P4M14_12050 [Gammaproteobacteria bacterium]|nr:hypothetical protein [Gammaproteobacteria bacterium]
MKNIFLAFVGILSTLFLTNLYAYQPAYEIIIDAGSSGSRLHLFQSEQRNQLPEILDIFSESIKPGLSSFASNPDGARDSIKKLLDDALVQLDKNHIDPRTVKVNIMATAGMRLLSPERQLAIYASITQFIQKNYAFALGQIETIPGKMEGLYGWLDVNYLSHTFQNNTATIGSIDLGGASTQIAFATQDQTKKEDEVTIKVNQQQYTVFSKSFLSLGQDQALAAISQDAGAASCFPSGYPLPNNVSGQFELNTCRLTYIHLIQSKHVPDEILPTANQHFIAYSGAYYDLNFLGVDNTPDGVLIENRIQAVCSASWEQLQKDYPSVAAKYLAPACANDTYVLSLLFWAYSLHGDQLSVTNQINQQDIDWTLGAELYKLVTP